MVFCFLIYTLNVILCQLQPHSEKRDYNLALNEQFVACGRKIKPDTLDVCVCGVGPDKSPAYLANAF